MFHRIYWDHFSNETYLYGTQLDFNHDSVQFKNALIPSGITLAKWFSKTNFQANRKQPDLPLLKPGQEYRIELMAKTSPVESLYIQLEFFDRYDNRIEKTVIDSSKGTFVYPKQAYSYQINLMNAGCSELEFHHIIISDESSQIDQQLFNQEVINPSQSSTLNVLFVEPGTVEKTNFSQDFLKSLSDVLILSSKNRTRYDLLTSVPYHQMMNLLEHQTKYSHLNLIGYGPLSNFVALYYGMILPNQATAYVTDNLADEHEYEERLDLSSFKQNNPIAAVLERFELAKDTKRARLYGQSISNEDYDLIKPILRSTEQLWLLPILGEKGGQDG